MKRQQQTRLQSLIESCANITTGAILSIVVTQALEPLLGFEMSLCANVWLTGLLTVVSVIRSYVIRRGFERWLGRK